MIAKPHQWPLSAVAVAVLLGLWSHQAHALSLGRINVLSALGEPLKAEIDILDINADEAATLNAKVASPETFKAAGLEYSGIMPGVRTSLNRRPDGRSYILLSSSQRINDPFVDLIIETRWSSGRIVRDYTLLIDPPKLNATPAVAPALTSSAPSVSVQAMAPSTMPAPLPAREKSAPAANEHPTATPPAANQAGVASATVVVKAGDTASKIAALGKSPNVSLDQVLVALLRANPQAFIEQNVNRIKAGSVLKLPTEALAGQINAQEARQVILAQSRDFNAYRQAMASNVPASEVAPSERSATGKLEASVKDKKPTTAAPDKLTLSKATIQGKNAEEQLAKAGNANEIAQRTEELTKNINELDKLASASQASAAASSAEAAASQPTLAPKVVPLPAPATAAEPSVIDAVLDNPLLPAAGAALVTLLAGLGWYRLRQRKQHANSLHSHFTESRLQPESFFGVSANSELNVADNPPTGSSMLYSPSQLDAVDDFDPVAEAAVYMAYGRDQQAEEILQEALLDTPERVSIHRKLLEIYAKRHDVQAFESTALLAAQLTHSSGTDWDSICAMGLTVDPGNDLYHNGHAPKSSTVSEPSGTTSLDLPQEGSVSAFTAATQPMPFDAMLSSSDNASVDLDLDFASPSALSGQTVAPVDFEPTNRIDDMTSGALASNQTLDDLAASLDFSLPPLQPSARSTETQAPSPSSPTTSHAPVEFNLDDISLDFNQAADPSADTSALTDPHPLESKLALAEQYRAIGDEEAARALIQEVIAAAADDVKAKAQQALDQL